MGQSKQNKKIFSPRDASRKKKKERVGGSSERERKRARGGLMTLGKEGGK